MEWLWDEWVGGVLCGGVGVCVHVQGGDPGLCQETGGEMVQSRDGCGASCAVGLGFVCMNRGVVRGCVGGRGEGQVRGVMSVGG